MKTVTWFQMDDILAEARLQDRVALVPGYAYPGGQGDTCLAVHLHPDDIPAFVEVFRPLAESIGLNLGRTTDLMGEAKLKHSGAMNTGVTLYWREVEVVS